MLGRNCISVNLCASFNCFSSLNSGNSVETRGTAFVVYEDIFDAKNACEHLSGFNVCNRYLVVLYYQPAKVGLVEYFFSFCIPL